jgi:hypothetical protein
LTRNDRGHRAVITLAVGALLAAALAAIWRWISLEPARAARGRAERWGCQAARVLLQGLLKPSVQLTLLSLGSQALSMSK